MPGRPPNENARRKNARPAFRRLPARGRVGDPPPWPLGGRVKPAERELWNELWASPQALAWEQLGWVRTVARYARVTIAAEQPGAMGIYLTEARQLEDRLGLNPKAMRSLGWDIALDDEETTAGDPDVVDLEAFRTRVG